MATPLTSSSIRTYTRRHPSSLVNPTPDPERVFRVRLHKLASRTLLNNLDQEALSDIHSLFCDPPQPDIMGDFRPCNFANIQGYPHNMPQKGMNKLPVFQGNDAVSVKSHLFAFNNWWNKFAVTNNNFDDVKMKTFVLTFGEDVHDWFTEKPDNSFDTFESIVAAFKEKYGDKREDRHLVREISTIKKKENETIEEFNRRFNGIPVSYTHLTLPTICSV